MIKLMVVRFFSGFNEVKYVHEEHGITTITECKIPKQLETNYESGTTWIYLMKEKYKKVKHTWKKSPDKFMYFNKPISFWFNSLTEIKEINR